MVMPRMLQKRSAKAGLPPGALIHIGEKKSDTTKITVMAYDAERLEQAHLQTADECLLFRKPGRVTWTNVDGLHEVALLGKLGECFGLHPLVLEDILNTDQRPKVEDFGDYVYIVLKMLYQDKAENEIVAEQVSLVLGADFLLCFQEAEGDVFDLIRERIRTGKGRLREFGADYLMHALLDAVVDGYYSVLEELGEEIELLQESVVASPTRETLEAIHQLKTEMLFVRRCIWPLREVVASLERRESPLIQEATDAYLRDVFDHVVQVVDTIETFREMLSGMLDIYLSSVSNRMNEVMKVLTIIATIFMPLTFLAGLYGMNFDYMPELRWRYGYPLLLIVMASVAAGMVAYFRKRQWI